MIYYCKVIVTSAMAQFCSKTSSKPLSYDLFLVINQIKNKHVNKYIKLLQLVHLTYLFRYL